MPRPKLVDKDGRFAVPVVIDTREQKNFTFEGMTCDAIDGGGPLTVPTVLNTLASGDYSLLGYETRVACERKSLADLYGTIGQGRDRFERELARLNAMDWAAVVIEATWPELCAEPPAHTKLPGKIVFRSILAWSVRYPRVHWFPAGPRRLAEITTFRLLERWLKEELGKPDVVLPFVADPGNCKTALEVAAHKLHEACVGAKWFQAVGVGNGKLVLYCREKPTRSQWIPDEGWQGFQVDVIVVGEITARGG
jgi:DNA excision repair protein ERCC-4